MRGFLVAEDAGEDGFLRVHTIFRLVEYDGIGVVYHAFGQFLSSIRRHVMHEKEVGLCGFHKLLIDLIAPEYSDALCFFVFLAHAYPCISIDDIGVFYCF